MDESNATSTELPSTELFIPTDEAAAAEIATDACIVIPMFNEAQVIADVVGEVRGCFDHVLCVDDGSSDDSAERAREAGASVIQHPVNLGQGAALQTGLSFALRNPDFDYFVTFDADGQHDPHDALAMVAEARGTGADAILGSRFLEESSSNVPLSRRILLRGAVTFTWLTTGMKLTDAHNGLRVLNRRGAAAINLQLPGMAHASEIVSQIGRSNLSYREFPVSIRYTDYSRKKGQSNINALNIAFDVMAHRVRRPS